MARKVIKAPREGVPASNQTLGPPPRSGLSRPSSNRRVMRQDTVEARSQADEIIQQAKQEALNIRSEAEAWRQQGFDKGYAEGIEIGKGEMTEAILRINRENDARFQHFERDLVKLSLSIAEKIIGDQLRVEPNTITDIVAKAIQGVRHQKEIFIRVNPEEYETIAASKYLLVEQLSRAQDVDIRPDPDIAQGGCLIESETGSIDASVEKQIAAIEKILLGDV